MKLSSFIRFGYYFARQILRRIARPHRGLEEFRSNYGADRLLPMTRENRDSLPSFSKCIACGLCDHAIRISGESSPTFLGPQQFALAGTRNLPDYDALLPTIEILQRANLKELERICPVHVPFEKMVEFADVQAKELRRTRLPIVTTR